MFIWLNLNRTSSTWLAPIAILVTLIYAIFHPQLAGGTSESTIGKIQIIPDQMVLSGDVTTRLNCAHSTVCAWLDQAPPGTILLGVNPASPYPSDWRGGTASLQVSLPAPHSPTLYVLKLTWPDTEGKGLHSPVKDNRGEILLDGKPLWGKRTTQLSTYQDYYAAQYQPIVTTLVVAQPGSHTLTIRVTPQTAWDISLIELVDDAYPAKIRGIGYSPFRDCQAPGYGPKPSTQEMQEDIFRLVHSSNAIRTYASTGVNHQIPALANAVGLPVFAGAWIDKNDKDDEEIQALIDLAHTTHLDGAIVGNEYYLRNRTQEDIETLMQKILLVKSQIPSGIPVMTAEIDNVMFEVAGGSLAIAPAYRPVLDVVDIVLVHIYPFWNRSSVYGAAKFTIDRYLAIQALIEREYPGHGKRVIIGEAGWPSGGSAIGQAIPALENQRRYLTEFLTLADAKGVEFFYFDAFDELWKIEEPGRVGQRWGYSETDRTAKHYFYGVLVPPGDFYQQRIFLPVQQRQPAVQEVWPSFWTDPAPGSPWMSLAQVALPPNDPVEKSADPRWVVYDEWPESRGSFVPSGYMGDFDNVSMYGCVRENPYMGEMALRASFIPTGTLGWGGVLWQFPENNWGNLPGGIDLGWANQITFYAKGEKGGEKIRFLAGGIGSEADPYPDSLRPAVTTGFIQLSVEWTKYTIDLRGHDLSHVIGGFGWVTDRCASPTGATFYLDEIAFEVNPNPPPPPTPGLIFPVYTEAASPNNHFYPTGWMGDGQSPGRVSLTECWLDQPHSGRTSIRVAYTQEVIGWAGGYWVEPPENWGDRPGGIDLTGADRLRFWARSEIQGAQLKILIGGVGYNTDSNGNTLCNSPQHTLPDSVCPKIQVTVTLQTQWTEYVINLQLYTRDFHKVIGGFGWMAESPMIFYLDDIVYEYDP